MCASHGRVTDVEPTMMIFYLMHPTPFINLTDLLHQPIIPFSSPSIQTAVEVSETPPGSRQNKHDIPWYPEPNYKSTSSPLSISSKDGAASIKISPKHFITTI